MSNKTIVQVEGENGTELIRLDIASATRLKQIMTDSMDSGEYPEEANEILGAGELIGVFGIMTTCGDGFGWYNPE